MDKIYLSLFICLILTHTSFSQKAGLNKIDTEDLKRHLSFIASDSLQGRKLGTKVPGLDIAADYIKKML